MVGCRLRPALPTLALASKVARFVELVADLMSSAGGRLRGGPGPILGPCQHEVRVDADPVRHHKRRPPHRASWSAVMSADVMVREDVPPLPRPI